MRRCLALFTALAAAAAVPCFSSVVVQDEEVIFRLPGTEAETVFLVGDFNGWNPTIDLMVRVEDGFEIRLVLLPGTYRYRYMVDGVPRPDPDNPCVDAEGRSCFTLMQRDGAVTVVLAEAAVAAIAVAKPRLVPVVRIDACAAEGAASLFSAAEVTGTIDENIDADLGVGLTGQFADGEAAEGRAFLLRSLAAYRFDGGVLRAFNRPDGSIDLGDPLALIGTVGPYRYPVSLFSRGVDFERVLPLGLEARLLYASRLSGYRSELEGTAVSTDLFSRRDFVDADLWGLKLGTKIGAATVRYLLRQDRRPKDGVWGFPPFGTGLYRGFERDEFQGFWLSLTGDRNLTVDGELLFGRSLLSATGRLREAGDDFRDVSREGEWEHGQRFSIGVSHGGGRLRSAFTFSRTTLEGERRLRNGRPDGSRTSISGSLAFSDSALSIACGGTVEQYSSFNTGSTFWLGRTNFWLDGDELSYDLIPFLSSRQVYEVTLSCAWNSEPLRGLPARTGMRLEFTERGDGLSGGSIFREIRLESGVAVHPRLTALLDMRGASYGYHGVHRDFVDAFLGLHAAVTRSLWCAVGTGVNPYTYDTWLYAFSEHGREDYLAERGVFRTLAEQGESASLRALIDAEEALAEDWTVTFEAGFTF